VNLDQVMDLQRSVCMSVSYPHEVPRRIWGREKRLHTKLTPALMVLRARRTVRRHCCAGRGIEDGVGIACAGNFTSMKDPYRCTSAVVILVESPCHAQHAHRSSPSSSPSPSPSPSPSRRKFHPLPTTYSCTQRSAAATVVSA
jgi:hypothetical protein